MFEPEAARGDGFAVEGGGANDRRRGCGKVGIPRVGRDSQAQWETCFWFSTERLFHGLLGLYVAATMRGL